jgi:Ca2+-binding RTX toxin-like protein
MFGRNQNAKGAKSAALNLGYKRKAGFRIEALEERRLMAADMMTNMAFIGPVQQPSTSTTVATTSFADPGFAILLPADTVLDAKWVQIGTSTAKQLVIDGSDKNDVITIESYGNYYLNGPTFTVKLEKFDVNGALLSSQRLNVSAGRGFVPWGTQPILVLGRDGADRITNLTSMSMTAVGGNQNDTLIGGSAYDALYGEGGQDTIYGEGGSDNINGGADNDSLFGGAGYDTVNGEGGDDRIWGGAESDRLYGGAGNDTIHGDNGVWDYYANFADTIYGGEGQDWLDGESGADNIFGEGGNDFILGSFGNDTLQGGAGNDYLYGEHGDDRIFGQDGIDYLFGGDHNDYLDGGYRTDPNSSIDQPDVLYGGAGKDTFARHRSTFLGLGTADPDVFADYGSGDSTDNIYHW